MQVARYTRLIIWTDPFERSKRWSYPITSLNRPLGLQEAEDRRISRKSPDEYGKIVSPMHRPPLPPGNIPALISVRGLVDRRAIVRPDLLCQWKLPMKIIEVEPATFRLIAQCLNQLHHRVSPFQTTLATENGQMTWNFKFLESCKCVAADPFEKGCDALEWMQMATQCLSRYC